YQCHTALNEAGAASEPTTCNEDKERHAAAQIAELLRYNLEVLIRRYQVLQGAPYRLAALEDPFQAQQRHVPHAIRRVHCNRGIKVAAIQGLSEASTRLLQVGRRGLLGHRVVLQAEAGEGGVPVEVGHEPRDLAVAQTNQQCSALTPDLVEVYAAGLG